MSETALRLREEILRLPEADRMELAQMLWDDLECAKDDCDESEQLWIEELDRRAAEADADASDAKPFREVIAELRGELS